MALQKLTPEQKREEAHVRIQQEEELLTRTALQLAGFTREDLQHALARTREALNATTIKAQVADVNGQPRFIYSDPLVDHAIRLEAADRMMRMVPGMYAPKHEAPSLGNLTVEVVTFALDGTKLAVRIAQ